MKIFKNKKMKTKFISYLVLLGVFVITYSCTDLEETLIGEVTAEVTTAGVGGGGGGGGASDVLAGPFSKLRDGTANHGGYFSVQGVSTDEMAVTQKGGDWYDGGIWLDMHRHTYTPANGAFNGTWGQLYGGINECNTQLEAAGISTNQTAQLRALRAYFYYRLLDVFGRVKIVTATGQSAPQSDRQTVFNFVESELLDVLGITSVTGNMDLTGSDLTLDDNKYRINQFAAMGILSKLYLNAGVYTGTPRWQEAHDAADYVITNGPYILSTDYSVPNLGLRPGTDDPENLVGYAAIFGANNEDNPEIIWSVAFDEVTGGGMNFHHMTLHYSSQFTWNFTSQPWNGYVALEEFYNSYDSNDKRKANNFIVGEQSDYGGSTIVDYSDAADPILNYTPFVNELEPNAQRDGGARLGKFSFKQFARNELDNDYPLVRLGDLMLIRGEAKARLGSWADALPDVNAIRARAGVSELTSLTAEQFLAERGREMFMESSRRRDLIRFGEWGNAWWEKPGGQASYLEMMPIPTEQMETGTGLTQNPGY